MLGRRELFEGALALTFGAACPSSGHAQARRHNVNYGCRLPHSEAAAFFPTATEAHQYITGQEQIFPQSGDRDFDYALAQTLGRISSAFDVAPGFAYYDDYDGRNAYATSDQLMNGADGTVLFGKRLLGRCLASKDNPELGVTCICAHEFGHILQNKLGLDRELHANQPTVKRLELNADFFAGYFAGLRKLERPGYPAAVFAVTLYGLGDDMLDNPGHHGTPDERAAAIVRGFDVAYRERRSLTDAIQIGVNYAKTQ
jgi:hypothetical protein